MQTADLLYHYLTTNVNNICRICLERNNRLLPIFDPSKPPHFPVLIMACATVQVSENDGLPGNICQKCVSKLNVAFQFKSQCEAADTKLRQCLSNYNTINIIEPEKQLVVINTINTNVQNNEDHFNSDFSDNTLTIQLAEDILSTSDDFTNGQVLQNLDLVDANAEPAKEKVLVLKLENSDNDNKVKDGQTNEETVKQKRLRKNSKQHQCDHCGKVFKTKPSLVLHIRVHTGERPYMCHVCEKRFVNGGHLYTHMRTHTGEKKHICAMCSKSFSTAQQLTKHTIAIHTSEKPYPCPYCGRRFANPSNMSTHTRIHTGVKNFDCSECTKKFATKAQLLQHSLVHSGVKRFLCEACDKRFSQKAHLERHMKGHVKKTDDNFMSNQLV